MQSRKCKYIYEGQCKNALFKKDSEKKLMKQIFIESSP